MPISWCRNICEAKGADIRCFVVGNKVMAAMKRQAKEGEFRSNLHRGGTASKVKLSVAERQTAIKAARWGTGLNVAGVDILTPTEGPVAMEVNSSPGLEGIEAASEVDVAGQIISYLEQQVLRHQSKTRILHKCPLLMTVQPKASPSRDLKPRQRQRHPDCEPFIFGNSIIAPGERMVVDIPFGKLYTHTELNIGAHVLHGKKPGPVLLITAALHGDEINGVEICRRLLKLVKVGSLRGTLVVVPIVNTYGFVQQSRYLPDRRDLNRSFPGSEKGSLGSRMAWQFTDRILKKCTHVIDLHNGAIHRSQSAASPCHLKG